MSEESKKTTLWTTDFILVNIARLFTAMPFMMLSATIATFSFETCNSTVSEAGIAVGAFILGALVSRVFAGRYTEVIGRKRLLLWGMVLNFVFSLAYFVPMGLYVFIALRFLHGTAFGVATNTVNVVGTEYIPQDRWGEGMGLFSLSATITAAIGPLVGLLLLQNISATALFAFSSACSFISMSAVFPLNVKKQPPVKEDVTDGSFISRYFEKKAIPLSALLMVWGICFSGVNSFINTYTGTLDMLAWAPIFFVVSTAATTLTRIPLGKLYDRKGDNASIFPCIVCFIGSLVVLALCKNVAMLMIASVLVGIGYGGLFFLANSIALKVAPPHRMGVAVSTFFVFADAGAGLGPMIMGFIHPLSGYSGMYAIGAAVVILSIPVYIMFHGRRAKRSA